MAFTARSQPARQAILAAARHRFTHDGYERTTVRAVASDAGVDPSMVMRYYQSKEGLFSAAIDVDLHLPDARNVPLEEIAGLLARHFVNRWEGELADEAIMILLRSAVTNPGAAERMRTVFGRQVVSLVRAVTHDDPNAGLRAGMISSQLLGLALSRYVLRLPPLVALDAEALIAMVTPVLTHFLTGPVPARHQPGS
jgi:AcrR family transcriptional regulator